jgi:hypothetical protein
MSDVSPAGGEIEQIAQAPALNALLAFWRRKCTELERLPRRADLAPEQMLGFLPFVTLIEVLEEPRRFKFRLVGTGVVGHTGREVTARYADSELFADRAGAVATYFDLPVSHRCPAYAKGRYRTVPTDREVAFEALLTPLCNGADHKVDMMLGALVGERLHYGESMGRFDYDVMRALPA